MPSLILWHWKDPRTQASQQVQENQDRSFAFVASYDVATKTLHRLTDDKARAIQRGPKDTWGVVSDASAYERDAGIKGFAFRDLYAVNLATGERKPIQQKVPGGGFGGFFGGGEPAVLAGQCEVRLVRHRGLEGLRLRQGNHEGGDRRSEREILGHRRRSQSGQARPFREGSSGWTRDGSSIVVRDNWDLWRLPVAAGAAVNLTGNGQKDQVRYQNRLVFDPRERRGIDLERAHVRRDIRRMDQEGRAGRWSIRQKEESASSAVESAKVDYRRARDANTWLYTRQTVVQFPDYYAADDGLRNERRLSEANPQQKDVAWTPGAMLVDYTCENGGGKHQAVLYLPAGYEKGKSYPTLTYIYEHAVAGIQSL